MPIAAIDVTIPAPATAASMIAESSAGNAKVKSPSRMISSSTHPLRAAAISPSEAPPPPQPAPARYAPPHEGAPGAEEQKRNNTAPRPVGGEPVRRRGRIE